MRPNTRFIWDAIFCFACPGCVGIGVRKVDFRHVIVPLLRKPGAFLNYRHREALYPSLVFRSAYDRLVADHGERSGVIEYLHVLKLAAEEGVERVEPLLQSQLAAAGKWRATEVRGAVGSGRSEGSGVGGAHPQFRRVRHAVGRGGGPCRLTPWR